MNDKTIQEIRELCAFPYLCNGEPSINVVRVLEIISRAEQEDKEEPLAVLADRKGYVISRIDGRSDGDYKWAIGMTFQDEEGNEGKWKGFEAPTYAAAEAKARKYLESLPDKEGK